MNVNSFLITGANGFVGRALCSQLISENLTVRGTLRSHKNKDSLVAGVEPVVIEPISNTTQWGNALMDIDTVVHLAARVHVMRESSVDPLNAFRLVNTSGTDRLAREAAAAGVKRFVFMSTIGVNGDNSENSSYREDDEPRPHNVYSISKLEAEHRLAQVAFETGMQVVVIRAPLVYGPGNPGNFLSLLRVVSKGYPLPFASITNRRSLIYVGNLVDALVTCARHPMATGNTYLVSDGDDVSLQELIRRTAAALGVPARLVPFPLSFMRLAGTLTGKSAKVRQLQCSLTVDFSKINKELGWNPVFSMEEGLRETATWFKES